MSKQHSTDPATSGKPAKPYPDFPGCGKTSGRGLSPPPGLPRPAEREVGRVGEDSTQ